MWLCLILFSTACCFFLGINMSLSCTVPNRTSMLLLTVISEYIYEVCFYLELQLNLFLLPLFINYCWIKVNNVPNHFLESWMMSSKSKENNFIKCKREMKEMTTFESIKYSLWLFHCSSSNVNNWWCSCWLSCSFTLCFIISIKTFK